MQTQFILNFLVTILHQEVCVNSESVFTCITEDPSPFLRWTDAIGFSTTYDQLNNIFSSAGVRDIFDVRFTQISNDGRNFTSTATRVRVFEEDDGRNITCLDRASNSVTASIRINRGKFTINFKWYNLLSCLLNAFLSLYIVN